MSQKIPNVIHPLVIKKTGQEHLKFWIKEILSYLGISIHDWKEMRSAYKSRRGVQTSWGQNIIDELSGDNLDRVKQSTTNTFELYVNELKEIQNKDLRKTIQFDIYELIEYLILDQYAKEFVEIGCFYAAIARYTINNYKEVRFVGIDFPDNLAIGNASLASDRLEFVSEYPLEWLRNTEKTFDVAVFNRVFCIINQEEIKRYLRVLKRKTRFIAFNEAARITMHPTNLNVDSLPVEGFALPGWIIHNYRRILHEEGYELIHYDVVRSNPDFAADLHFTIRGIAAFSGRVP